MLAPAKLLAPPVLFPLPICQGALSDVAGEKAQLEAQVTELGAELGRARAALEAAQAEAEEERGRSSAAAQELQGRLEALEATLAAKEEEAQRAAEAREVRRAPAGPVMVLSPPLHPQPCVRCCLARRAPFLRPLALLSSRAPWYAV